MVKARKQAMSDIIDYVLRFPVQSFGVRDVMDDVDARDNQRRTYKRALEDVTELGWIEKRSAHFYHPTDRVRARCHPDAIPDQSPYATR